MLVIALATFHAVVEVEKEKWKRRFEKLEQKVETPRHRKLSRIPAQWKHK